MSTWILFVSNFVYFLVYCKLTAIGKYKYTAENKISRYFSLIVKCLLKCCDFTGMKFVLKKKADTEH